MTSTLESLQQKINESTTQNRGLLIRKLIEIKQGLRQGKDQAQKITELENLLEASLNAVAIRHLLLPDIEYPELPISDRVDEIKKAITYHQVIIVAGETGSGKSTQLPKICLDLGRGAQGLIGHTQPRRLAARSVSNRLAEEIKTSVGDKVGFKVRFSDGTSENTLVKLMTDGILLAEIQNDRLLSRYDTIIIDEAHERSLNIDFLLGYLKQMLPKRPDLKVIITSATIDHERFSKHFNNAPIIEVSGRTYPVEMRYNDYSEYYAEGMTQPEAIGDALNELSRAGNSAQINADVLVFLATEREIHETAEHLRKLQLRNTEVMPLYARLSNAEQQKIFSSHTGRRIILSTNVAETSITVPGIRYVIDPGNVRISRYSYRTKVQRLPIEPISQASANQRAGRCGRVAPGICIRLYSEEDFQSRVEFTDPEIQRTNLASVILQMQALGLGRIEDFPFLEMPDSRLIKDGYRLLHELKAIDDKRKVLPLGRILSRLPLDPKLARMLAAANEFKCLSELLIIVSFLSVQDPRERPMQFQEKSSQCHRQDWHDQSDFMTVINLWNRYHAEMRELSNNQMRRYCQKQFLSVMKMREWRDIYRQLKEQVLGLGWRLNKVDDNAKLAYENIHKSLATGLLSYIGFNHEAREYLGARGIKFFIFPGSSQFKGSPKWLITSELVETTKLYARSVARISPDWLEKIADHLVKRHYSEPFWSKKNANVMASMRVSLYGLDIVPNRNVAYASIDSVVSREIFIRHALVYGEFQSNADFYQYNLMLLEDVEELEHKSRRRDVLVDDETLFSYYDKLIPEDVCNGATFNRWLKALNESDRKQLFFEKEDVMQHGAEAITKVQYPDVLQVGDFALPLSYHFEPGAKDDGVTVEIPTVLIEQIPVSKMDWLVPGMLEDKIIALMRALPKNIRKACVPVPHYAKAVLEAIGEIAESDAKGEKQDFYAVLVKQLIRITGMVFDELVWAETVLEPHHKMNYRVVDEKRKVIAEGRDFSKIKNELKGKVKTKPQAKIAYGEKGLVDWGFGELKKFIKVKQYGIELTLYPCLIDHVDSVELTALPSQTEADLHTLKGILRLCMLRTATIVKGIRNNIPENTKLSLLFAKIANKQEWQADFLTAVYASVYPLDVLPLPRNSDDFYRILEAGRGELIMQAEKMAKLLVMIMSEAQVLQKKLARKAIPLDLIEIYQSIKTEMDDMIYAGFIQKTPLKWLSRIEIYLKALDKRLEKAPRVLIADRSYVCEMEDLKSKLQQKIKQRELKLQDAAVQEIHWLMKELWISWYAQDLKTVESVSVKRIVKRIAEL
jgi:ATP-dependent helicase HrpA